MNFKNLIVIICVAFSMSTFAQEKTILTIENQQFSVDEFNYIYEKNNGLSQTPVSKQEYLELFANYKLKVVEAQAQGLDTIPSFQQELAYYYNELAKPYLTDKKAVDEVVAEAYENITNEVDASHILIKFPRNPSSEDTLKAYNEIVLIQNELHDGADFNELAKAKSQDPSAQSNNGRLGYFSGFMMVYPFEKAAFTTAVGEVSPITRTSFGYHLIKVHGKRKNPGEVHTAHIMKMFPNTAPDSIKVQKKAAIDSLYQELLKGADFATMAKANSDDRQSAEKGGELNWFGSGRMVAEYANAAFELSKEDSISEPIKTAYGWHIIKLLDTRPVASLEEQREEIEKKIAKDERGYAGTKSTIIRLKSEYNYTQNNQGLELVASTFDANEPNQEKLAEAFEKINIELASFASEKIMASSFAQERVIGKLNTSDQIKSAFDKYVDDQILAYEKSQLKEKYPDFKFLMNEYHDGLLIFEISQNEIWSKASSDTLELERFFNENKADYKLPERFEGTLYLCKKKKDLKALTAFFAANDSLPTDSLPSSLIGKVEIKTGSFEKGEYPTLDQQVWEVEPAKKGKVFLVKKGELKGEEPQALNDVRGQVISDYQTALETEWVKSLREKYQPVVNDIVIKDTKQ